MVYYFFVLLFLPVFLWAQPLKKSALVVNFGGARIENYLEFNTELLLISSKYPRDQVQILNAAGSGEQFNTNKIDAKGNLIFVQGLPAPPATLDNMRRALVNQLNNGKTDSFIFITGHGGRGDVASATPSGAQLQTYQYSELVSKIISRPNKDKKVKLLIANCYSGSVFYQFKKTSDFDANFCIGTTATAEQLSRGASSPEALKAPRSLEEYLAAFAQSNISSLMTSSIRYAELALAEASINDDGAFSCKLKPAFDIKLLPFVQYVSQAVSESWHVPRSQFSNSAYYSKMKCQMQQFVEANPAEKSRFDRAFPKQGTTENNSRWLLEYNLLREKSDAYYLGDHTIDSAKMLSCISSDIPDWFKQEFSENLKQAASALRERDSSGEKNIQEIVKKQSIPMMFLKKFYSISRLKKSEIGTSEDRPPQEEDLLNKYKNDPDLFSAFDTVTDANTQNEAGRLNKYITSIMKKFEQLLKTPFGNRYKKTYEALKKCESENTH